MTLRILILIALLLALDFYVFQAFRFGFRNSSDLVQRITGWFFWTLSFFSVAVLIIALFKDWSLWPKAAKTYAGAFIFILVMSKLVLLIFLLTDDIFRGIRWAYIKLFSNPPSPDSAGATGGVSISRSDFLVRSGLIVASLPFVGMLWGMVRGAYDYQVKKVKLPLSKLPDAFKGFKIVQISDLHVGSFVSTNPLKEVVRIINDLQPDLILFTGDLVNNRTDELFPHQETLSQLKARHGVFSVLGNHDYGDYVPWSSLEEKNRNLSELVDRHRAMGWDILLDEHRHIEKDGERISLIGVQNWSVHLRFPQYGSLKKAVEGMTYSDVNILLSHDPSHWRAEVLEEYPAIDLMLAGHTHGFQFGVDLPGFKWSPVQYVYKEWAGLYAEGKRYLYVNRGLGFLGYPGRVGILPEITVLELAKA
jgi:predicted MPP superfamily phosphohydrolase/succinate dehydrogenase/fumarate reductase cytochrome b subunit